MEHAGRVTCLASIIALGELYLILAHFAIYAHSPMVLTRKMLPLLVSTNHLETVLLSVLHQDAQHWCCEHAGSLHYKKEFAKSDFVRLIE